MTFLKIDPKYIPLDHPTNTNQGLLKGSDIHNVEELREKTSVTVGNVY